MSDETPIERLQQITDYRTAIKHMRLLARQGIYAGVLWLFVTALVFNGGIVDYINLGLGAAQLLASLIERLKPSPLGFLLEGSPGILLGIINIAVQFMGVAQVGPLQGNLWIDAFAIAGGFWLLVRYRQYRGAFTEPPTSAQLDWFKEVFNEIRGLRDSRHPEIVQFTSGAYEITGRRFGELLFFVDNFDSLNLIIDRRDVDCSRKGRSSVRGARYVNLRLGKQRFRISHFTNDMLARLESWCLAHEIAEEETEESKLAG